MRAMTIEERNEWVVGILTRMDPAELAQIMPTCSSDEIRVAAAHKARYESTSVPAELRHASRSYLEAHGLSRLHYLPWPPPGQLPE